MRTWFNAMTSLVGEHDGCMPFVAQSNWSFVVVLRSTFFPADFTEWSLHDFYF